MKSTTAVIGEYCFDLCKDLLVSLGLTILACESRSALQTTGYSQYQKFHISTNLVTPLLPIMQSVSVGNLRGNPRDEQSMATVNGNVWLDKVASATAGLVSIEQSNIKY